MKNFISLDGDRIVISEETAENMRKLVKGEISVPDCIEFETANNRFGLKFNGDRSMRWYDGLIVDRFAEYNTLSNPKLVKCNRKDLNAGDWAFRTDMEEPDFTCKPNYSLIVDDKNFRCVDCDEDVIKYSTASKYWYKVVRGDK